MRERPTDPTPKLLLVAFGVCALVVAAAAGMRFQAAKRFWHAREVLTAAVVDPSRFRDRITVVCQDCDWRELLGGLPEVDTIQCYDDAIGDGERGVRCRVFFDGSQCLDADVFGSGATGATGATGAWRVETSARVYRPCLP